MNKNIKMKKHTNEMWSICDFLKNICFLFFFLIGAVL